VRWMWQHLVEGYARHNGHAGLLDRFQATPHERMMLVRLLPDAGFAPQRFESIPTVEADPVNQIEFFAPSAIAFGP